MKRYRYNMKAVLAACACIGAFSACSDMFETDSSSVVFEDGNDLQSPNDSLYSVMGILSKVQRLGDRYVLFGELRGDLMKATHDADVSIQQISDFNVGPDNVYRSFNDYYDVINNCNYAIQRMDTSIVFYEDKVMLPEFAQIKAIRAWTYWQLALAKGEVNYIEEPVVSLEAAMKSYPVVGIERLAELLIEDLRPYTGIRELNYGAVNGLETTRMFFPIDMLLGDFYLFLNRYADAAQCYYRMIDKRNITMASNYTNRWNGVLRNSLVFDWLSSYTSSASTEMLTMLAYSDKPKDYHPQLIRLSYNEKPSIVPAVSFVNDMSRSTYFYPSQSNPVVDRYFMGDLRGQAEMASGRIEAAAYGPSRVGDYNGTLIYKFWGMRESNNGVSDPENDKLSGLNYVRRLPVYRASHAYLRLAEAINRYGKPSMAFAVLKYGLKRVDIENPDKVTQGERTGEIFLDFTAGKFDGNVGTATRGRGMGISYDNERQYVIPDYTRYEEKIVTDEGTGDETVIEVPTTDPAEMAEALADSILFVEDRIMEEMAAETCFEGNRFFDLMRVGRHRGNWCDYAAGMVAERFEQNKDAIKAKLKDEKQWFLK